MQRRKFQHEQSKEATTTSTAAATATTAAANRTTQTNTTHKHNHHHINDDEGARNGHKHDHNRNHNDNTRSARSVPAAASRSHPGNAPARVCHSVGWLGKQHFSPGSIMLKTIQNKRLCLFFVKRGRPLCGLEHSGEDRLGPTN